MIGVSSCYSAISLSEPNYQERLEEQSKCFDKDLLAKFEPLPSNIKIEDGNVIQADKEAANWIVNYSKLRKHIKLWLSEH
jgi:hypothetical protein